MKRSILVQIGSADDLEFDELLGEVRMAEELGIDSVWCFPAAGAKGDFRDNAPLIWLSALASQTERIRLGCGLAAMLAPTRPPIRVAEQAAAIDLGSKGRLDLAFIPDGELDDHAEGPWDEGMRMLVDMWDQPAFSWTSERFTVMPVDVVPKPVQRPHPPLWLAGWSPSHAMRAGQAGMAFFDISGGTDESLILNRDAYSEARAGADADDLLSMGMVAIAVEPESLVDGDGRFEAWEDLGIDEVVIRTRPVEGDHEEAMERIRFLANGTTGVH
jgi:alkanesulfonate monooxygenase SsuD/methylene tetrahydromethanopterin reductase-like flavin-dependent oxidoreductase (luciferase family)